MYAFTATAVRYRWQRSLEGEVRWSVDDLAHLVLGCGMIIRLPAIAFL